MGYDLFIAKPDETMRAQKAAQDALFAQIYTLPEEQASPLWDQYNALPDDFYFRLNVWGMGRWRRYLDELDMLVNPAQPAYPDETEGDPAESDEPELSAEELAAQQIARQDWTDASPDPNGIPGYKLGSNDGWLVTSTEISNALSRYDEAKAREVVAPDDWAHWLAWITYLRAAVRCGGFRVY